jgi:hypothetical protein
VSPKVEYTPRGLRMQFSKEEIEATKGKAAGELWRLQYEGSWDVNTEDEKAAAEKQFKDIHGNIGPTEITDEPIPMRGERDFPRVLQQRGRSTGAPIKVWPSPTADTRTCDFANTPKKVLLDSSKQHIADVQRGLCFFINQLTEAAIVHDDDKITDIDGFHRDFVNGFKEPEFTTWWAKHRQLNRHHLNMADGVREDVDLIDVLDYITDCVMAGMARSGSVYELKLDPDVLQRAFQNTVELLKANVTRVE